MNAKVNKLAEENVEGGRIRCNFQSNYSFHGLVVTRLSFTVLGNETFRMGNKLRNSIEIAKILYISILAVINLRDITTFLHNN